MRSLVLLLVLISAFYVLLADQKPGKGSGKTAAENKSSEVKNETQGEASYFSEGLPADFMPSDLTRFGTLEKLKGDLNFRRMKMDHQLDDEMKEFKETRDKSGKDKEAYRALIKKHNEVREEFHDKYVEQVQEYKRMRTEMYKAEEKGLR